MADVTTTESTGGGGTGIVDKVRQRAAEQLSSQKNRAFDGIGSVAQAVRQSTHQLRDQQHETLAGYVEQAADQIDRFARQLREKDVSELLNDAQRLARRQPAIFVGSAFALGLLGARFLKSSTQHGHDGDADTDSERRFGSGRQSGSVSSSAHQYGGASSRGSGYATSGVASSPTGTSASVGSGVSPGSAAGTSVSSGSGVSGSGVSGSATSGGTRAAAPGKTDSPGTSSGRGRRSSSETERS